MCWEMGFGSERPLLLKTMYCVLFTEYDDKDNISDCSPALLTSSPESVLTSSHSSCSHQKPLRTLVEPAALARQHKLSREKKHFSFPPSFEKPFPNLSLRQIYCRLIYQNERHTTAKYPS